MNTTTLDCQRLIACRKKLGITKQEAAIRMKLSQPAYLRYESGDRVPSIHVIYYMAHVFGTSADYLMGKTDDPNPDVYFIFKQEKSDLFDIIDAYHKSDNNTKNRLLTYLQALSAPEQ